MIPKILLAEDNAAASDKIKKFINAIDPKYETVIFSKASEALTFAGNEDISLFILDIQLKDYKGTDLAKLLRTMTKYRYTPIIFETALAGEELFAYRNTQCYAFLIKPFSQAEFNETFITAMELSGQLLHKTRKLRIEQKQFIFEYSIDEIAYVESFGKKVAVYTKKTASEYQQNMISGYSLAKMLELINDPSFIQCHRSYLVNTNHIKKIDKSSGLIILHGGSIPVGSKYQSTLW